MLAGIPAGPELYSPKRDLTKALGRRSFVLDQMKAKHFINDRRRCRFVGVIASRVHGLNFRARRTLVARAAASTGALNLWS